MHLAIPIYDDSLNAFNEDDVEFEWTMLEMDLAKEGDFVDDNKNFVESTEPDKEHLIFDESGLSEMNPEEMLKYIQNDELSLKEAERKTYKI